MDDINIISKLNIKQYFRISILIFFRWRRIITTLVYFILIQFLLFYWSHFDWISEATAWVVFLIFYLGLFPLIIYISCRQKGKKVPALRETFYYTINTDKVEFKAESISMTTNWQHFTQMIEREDYFLLMPNRRSFNYLPKAGFESLAEVDKFRDLVREKGIKISHR